LDVAHHRAHRPSIIDALVLEEAPILDRQEGSHHGGGHALERHHDPALRREMRQDLTGAIEDPARLGRSMLPQRADRRASVATAARPEPEEAGARAEHTEQPEERHPPEKGAPKTAPLPRLLTARLGFSLAGATAGKHEGGAGTG